MIKNSKFSKDDIQEIYKTIGKNVKRIREQKGISQLQLAMAIGHKAVGVISNCELCLQNKHFNIEQLINERNEAKKQKDFASADAIRDKLTELEISVMDTTSGVVWEKI